MLQDLKTDDYKSKPDCICADFSFVYNPTGQVIKCDFNIINNSFLWDLLIKIHNFKMLVDSFQDYAKQWKERENEDIFLFPIGLIMRSGRMYKLISCSTI